MLPNFSKESPKTFLLLLQFLTFLFLLKFFVAATFFSLSFPIHATREEMASAPSNLDRIVGSLASETYIPSHEVGVVIAEDEKFPTVDEVVPRPGKARTDFKNPSNYESEPIIFAMDVAALTAFKAKWRILIILSLFLWVVTSYIYTARDIAHFIRTHSSPDTHLPFLPWRWTFVATMRCVRLSSLRTYTSSSSCPSSIRSWRVEGFLSNTYFTFSF